MRLLNDWIPDSLLQALGWTLVHSLWQLVLIAAILWGVLKLAHRSAPGVKYTIAVGALFLAIFAGVGTFVYEFNAIETRPVFSTSDFQILYTDPSISSTEVGLDAAMVKTTWWINQNIPLLVNAWFLGSLLFLFRLVNSLSEIRSLRKSSTPVSDFQLQKIAYRLVGKMGLKIDVQLRISRYGISPLTFGTFKPIILLPAGLIFHLSPVQLEAIIAHELAHVKRNDYLINLVLSGLEVIFFYHPCYWWMNQTVKELRENAADDLAIKAGIEPKNLATGLAEVLNFAKQNPPELALAASKKRNPTLQRIKRILGYPAQNYPQNPIISIPMMFTLMLSLGLLANGQQNAPKAVSTPESIIPMTESIPTPMDTLTKKKYTGPNEKGFYHFGEHVIVFSDGENSYRISEDTLFSGNDTIILSGKTKLALDQFRSVGMPNVPNLDIPMPPVFPEEFEMAPVPEFNLEFPPMEFEALAMIPMEPMPSMPPMPPMGFEFDGPNSFQFFFSDTLKMTTEEKEKLAKDMAKKSDEWSKIVEEQAKEFAKRSEEWAAKWKEGEPEREAKMEAWKKEFEPKMKEFELKMKEWQAAQEPKMKEFELKMKEWEAAQKPKMEEFQKKMEVWQKEHEAKLEEFQKLLREELKKDEN
ncbi:hypothetical protein D0X99_03310 [Algoriphagus lacus]|uniref:Peptidase M56 domain-containing protein n=1 Tax=Algoriphagus lacus TaxID=2056311 RepID=A0A418PXD7_9BACT|nr:M56 family metallopeptidase [Algoriphagus lacus]RIW18723.1 hypothetical protein D0X99_03310 [Algoriphagus lacus]